MAAEQQRRPQVYVGMATVGEWIGVSGASVAVYRKRYADTDHPCPEPDVVVREGREVPGWLPSRAGEWQAWAAGRVGPGVGGGRPRKQRE
ncbi:hypothetical protein AB0I81_40130 [Nonomuraea sp. NPDC050404]|uniref:hypothetical protein n=1 Tax=Nonomuraea sp. NPDC050404 TaxID=3155783 RepID=UPI0034102477